MHRLQRLKCLLISVILLFAANTYAGLPPAINQQQLPSLAPVLENVKPSVVNILATGRTTNSQDALKQDPQTTAPSNQSNNKEVDSVGSGVIVDAKNGYILTNSHLITQAKSVTVTLSDGRHFKAKLIGKDVATDIAVLQIRADHLKAVTIGDSSQLNVGDFVIAIGNPYGLNQTVTSGIISALERNDLGIEGYEDFIQTDASINPGNSGGALINLKGELIGINTAIFGPHGGNVGIGFAIPSNMAKTLMDQLVEYGNLGRGLVGIMIQTLTPEIAKALHEPQTKGAVVTNVSPNSPAALAGVKIGDVIVEVNGKTISTAGQVRNAIGLQRAGSKFAIRLIRDDKVHKVNLTSAEPEAYKKTSNSHNPFFHDIVMKNFDAEVPGFGHLKGVQALQIAEHSPSWQAGLRPGDVILRVDANPTANIDQLLQASQTNKAEVLVNLFRSNGAMFVVINRQA